MSTSACETLSISIVHHDGLKALADCLQSIFSSGFTRKMEVVVVDNVSTDGAVSMIRKEYPQIKLLENEVRHGFGQNQNRGIQACTGEYILVLNDDTIVQPGALETLCLYLDQHSEAALVGPRLLNPDGSLQKSCYKFPTPLRCVFENTLLTALFPNSTIFGDYRGWQHDSIQNVDFVIGAAMLVRRQVVEQVGLFDPLFFMYAEETDWQLRMHRAGWKIAFTPQASIMHIGGQSSEGMKDRQFCEFHRSYAKYMRKHFGLIGAAVQWLFMIVGALLRLVLWTGLSLAGKKAEGERQIQKALRITGWWLGMGPHQGIAELTQAPPAKSDG